MTEAKTSPNVQTINKWYEANRAGDRAAMAGLCKDGKITRLRQYADTVQLSRALS
jgi:ketosteroid isomerase-like protein